MDIMLGNKCTNKNVYNEMASGINEPHERGRAAQTDGVGWSVSERANELNAGIKGKIKTKQFTNDRFD